MTLMAQVEQARSSIQAANEQLLAAKGTCTPNIPGCGVSILLEEVKDRINDEIDSRRTDVAVRESDRGDGGGSDWAGYEILKNYLAGGDDWTINNDPRWTDYMKAAPGLEEQVNEKLRNRAQALSVNVPEGETVTVPISETFHAETVNGESVNGYQYLHGTNANAGGYQIQGTATITNTGDDYTVKFNVSHTWNDIIDPNPEYSTDTWKSRLAEIATLGRADPYDIHISWDAESTIQLDRNRTPVIAQGWPGD